MEAEYGTLIVGQGLAGSLLAWEMAQRGEKVLVVDDAGSAASSRVAAGMINPLAGRRLALYPETEHYLEATLHTYQALAETFQRPFFHPLPIFRYFQSEEEKRRYEVRLRDPVYAPYLGEITQGHKGLEGFITLNGGWLDVSALLQNLRSWLENRNAWQRLSLDYAELEPHPGGIRWQGIRARQVVFCEGWRGQANPWFKHLRWDPVKGEILRLDAPNLPTDRILNCGKWLVPSPGQGFRGGSTYSRDLTGQGRTESGKKEILAGLKVLTGASMAVTAHEVGIRPGTRTQHPFIGSHPAHPALAIFNGFGSKGAFLIPYLTKIFCDHQYRAIPLPPTMDIRLQWER